MNRLLVIKIMGAVMLIEAAFLVLPLIVALLCGEGDWIWFLVTIIPCAAAGALLYFLIRPSNNRVHASEGFFVVALAWVLLSAIAAVPLFISGSIPDFLNAMFETVSGFTTSGCTAIDDVEALSNSMLFWRSLTHWIGGMGILVFMLAISPIAGAGSAIHILRAESPGPVTEKISPKISTTAKYLYVIYLGLTLLEMISLTISGMSVLHSSMISFGTMATGGFSYLNTSAAAFTSAQQTIITVFMVLAGVNFSLFFLIITGKGLAVFRNEELRWYLVFYFALVAVISVNLIMNNTMGSARETIHKVFFMVASLLTTTGFSVCSVDGWPAFSRNLIMLFMFMGACAGSTAGGIKISRVIIEGKSIKNGLRRLIHPRKVSIVRFNGKDVGVDVVRGVAFYFGLFAVLFAASMAIVSIDPLCDFTTAFSAVNTTINNNGIGFGAAGGSFSVFKWYSKVVFILDMLIGRLEIFPMIMLFHLSIWRGTIIKHRKTY